MSMRVKPIHQRERIKNIILCFTFICSFINYSAFAETDTEYTVLANLVYFRPMIYIPEKAQPCQGVRVSERSILTSPECQKKVLGALEQAVPVEAMNSDSVSIGHIKASYSKAAESSLLSIELDAGDSHYEPLSVSTGNASNDTELMAYYLEYNDGIEFVEQIFSFDMSTAGNRTTISLPNNNDSPDGALVSLHKKAFCVVSGDLCVMISSLQGISSRSLTLPGKELTCVQEANKTYHFNCGSRTVKYCRESFPFLVNGACKNPLSGQHCTFTSLYVPPGEFCPGGAGDDNITCGSCSAYYVYCTGNYNPTTVTCKPRGCMPGCKGKPDSEDSNLIAPIVGSVVGGLALIGTIVAVTGCLIYKYRYRATYQNL